ncbi:Protein-disulfide isomerase [Pseudomonas asturiensis]|uniref:Protein-disulfide isomerase n=1 Tax=Pseudomonas asturiensis TaxID=1190415 RepID=A0A1M7PBV2_9PSED|nr:DsbA family protein [Pseudomonas asturiensis]SHN14343.1 Protein-disulfide isomerase [Pseudomonas asturiensis]
MNRRIIYLSLLGAVVALAVGSYFLAPAIRQHMHDIASSAASQSEQEKPDTPWVYGRESARFTIVEYADLECPYCKDYFPRLKAWIDTHPDANLQWHHLPLPMHEPMASYEARWAECAGIEGGNNAFWRAVGLIYSSTRSNGSGPANAPQLDELGDRQAAIDECASNHASVLQKVRAQTYQASLDGITATPTLIVKDKATGRSIKLQGAPDGDVLLSAIDWLSNPAQGSGSK